MKRSLFLTLGLLFTLLLSAGNVTPEQAAQTARQFLSNHQPALKASKMKMAARKMMTVTPAAESTAYYVFNIGQDNGYVMVSGSDLAPEVLAYATSGSFDQQTMPENKRAWLQGYADQIAYLESTGGKYETQRKVVERAAIEPLLTSTWNQQAPYNDLCPLSNGERTVTGCVATALAQVIYYHKYPAQTTQPIPGYTTQTLQFAIPETPVTAIDWNNMLDNYNGTETEEENQAVATLMMLCGRAVAMNYNVSAVGGSGAFTSSCVDALRNYFGYDQTAYNALRRCYSTSAWEELIYNELANNGPVLYGGQSSTGGHAFVVDGYRSDSFFHINWGWGGTDNEYFLLSVLNPYNNEAAGSNSSDDGFSFDQDAMIGVHHGQGGQADDNFHAEYVHINGDKTFTRSSSNKDFSQVRVDMNVWNNTGTDQQFTMGVSVQYADGTWAVDEVFDSFSDVLPNALGYTDLCWEFSFGSNMADGDYYIVPVVKLGGEISWKNMLSTDINRVKATISGNTLTLMPPVIDLAAELVFEEGVQLGKRVELEIPVQNHGTYYNNTVFLLVDGKNVGGRMLEVEAGGTTTLNIDFVPVSPGVKQLQLAYKPSVSSKSPFIPFATGTIEVIYDPITVAEALNIITALPDQGVTKENYIVKGVVTGSSPSFGTMSNGATSVTFYMADQANGTQRLYIYKSYQFNGENISKGLLNIGDEVVVMGKLQKYGTGSSAKKEISFASIVAINGGTAPDPYDGAITVAEARTIALSLANKATTSDVYRVKGYVVTNPVIQKKNDGSFYGNANFDIADQPGGTTTLLAYRLNGIDNENIDRSDYIQKGYKVVLEGKLQNYNGTPEIIQGYIAYMESIPTAITTIAVELLQDDGIRYNMAGQRVIKGYKGIVMVNGRKILAK